MTDSDDAAGAAFDSVRAELDEFVIGRSAHDVTPEVAWGFVGGITLFNDASLRALGVERQNVFYGKNLERSSPLGPIVITPDELDDFCSLRFTLTVNGETRQLGNPSDLVFDVRALVADLSKVTTLMPGDMIGTGTPGGVAMGFDPPRWLEKGDIVELSCERLGVLRTRFI